MGRLRTCRPSRDEGAVSGTMVRGGGGLRGSAVDSRHCVARGVDGILLHALASSLLWAENGFNHSDDDGSPGGLQRALDKGRLRFVERQLVVWTAVRAILLMR